MKVLVINCGSSSVKYQLVDLSSGDSLVKGKKERLEGKYSEAIASILSEIGGHEIGAVGHRVVHGGQKFTGSVLIDDEVEAAIEACIPLAPLHNPANLQGIRSARKALAELPHFAVFDTTFHSKIPGRAATYAIDCELAEKEGIRRYGFHGSSHAYVAQRAAEYLQRPLSSLRIVTCHLGNGASACAVEFGHSVETSMGMTPLEGLVMGTRSGDIDAGIVLSLCRKLGVDDAEELLNRKSGLAGLSGLGKDLRDIEKAAAEGHKGARKAISVFAHQVRKYIGAYAAVMGGIDAVVFTGGIGENSSTMRQRILQRLDFLGLCADWDANLDCKLTAENDVVDLSAKNSGAKALAIATNEELYIAKECQRLVGELSKTEQPGAIPIAISGRHLHLDRKTMDILFGEGSELEVYKEISQPGQFASAQKVNLIGPRNRIDGVRVLGPLRSKNQIEISRTDEFRLGVDAPIRRSGQVEGSAPIVLEGPQGTVQLSEGLICARRHIHMTTKDAEAYGVSNGDEVEVEISGGPRDLTFGDVLVRVKDSYKLEMHIDTDEANAAELSRGASGELIYSDPDVPAQASLRRKS